MTDEYVLSSNDVQDSFNAILDSYSHRLDRSTNFLLICKAEIAAQVVSEVSITLALHMDSRITSNFLKDASWLFEH